MKDTIAIIGGGIAGLTCAIAFEKLGYKTTVFESRKSIEADGAGIAVAGNAIGAFKLLDIDQAIIARGQMVNHFPILDENGRTLFAVKPHQIKKNRTLSNFAIHRAELHQALLSQIVDSEVKPNKRLKNIEEENNGYRLSFEDDTSDFFNYVIGADGIRSQVRQFVNPKSKIRFAGYDCWRGITENFSGAKDGFETWGKKGRFGMVPLADNKIAWYLCLNRKGDKPLQKSKAALAKLFQNYHDPIPEIINSTPTDSILFNPIIDLKPHKIYTKGNILLIGDAAHATTPNLGQGACQAIETVATLFQLLQDSKDLRSAFKDLEKKRIRRTHYIANTSWLVGKAAQLENPILVGVRNFIFRNTPSRINNKQIERVIYNTDYTFQE